MCYEMNRFNLFFFWFKLSSWGASACQQSKIWHTCRSLRRNSWAQKGIIILRWRKINLYRGGPGTTNKSPDARVMHVDVFISSISLHASVGLSSNVRGMKNLWTNRCSPVVTTQEQQDSFYSSGCIAGPLLFCSVSLSFSVLLSPLPSRTHTKRAHRPVL